MSSPFAARAEYQRDQTLKVTFRFRREVVESLKDTIPASARAYDPDEKAWFISPGWTQVALASLRWYFDEVEVIEYRPLFEPEPIRKTDPTYAELHLLPSAPWPVVEAVYRAMARLNHPDTGGDGEKMKRLNLAYESLQRRAGAA